MPVQHAWPLVPREESVPIFPKVPNMHIQQKQQLLSNKGP